MPLWIYNLQPFWLALLMVGGMVAVSLLGLELTRRFLKPQFNFHEGVSDAVSATVQAIGVFYGITAGLIAVGIWNTATADAGLVSAEAASIAGLYRDASGLSQPAQGELSRALRAYTLGIIEVEWPQQRRGHTPTSGTATMLRIQNVLMAYEPKTEGQKTRYAEALAAFNSVSHQRTLRVDAVSGGLSEIMWWVIWAGAAVSVSICYFFVLQDHKLHLLLVSMIAVLLGVVLFMIVINDKPFYGTVSISSDSYQLVVDHLMMQPGEQNEPAT